ncbi:MAG: phenylalanine--tRNA ligase subunit beta [Metamycoplasmataceae bacterium]
MLFSELKLRELGNIPKKIKLDDIVNAINSIGFEVEEVIKHSDELHGLKFGLVQKTYKNTNADNLTVCEILFEDKTRIIQTTATNVVAGKKVVAFVPGSRKGDIVLKEKELKGIISEGMLASLDELGFPKEYLPEEWKEGIFQDFDSNVKLSADPIEYFELTDNLIDVSILSNRSDAISYKIFSQELAAYFNIVPNKIVSKKANFISDKKIVNSNNCFLNGVDIKDNEYKTSIFEKLFIVKNRIKLGDELENILSLIYLYSGVSIRAFKNELLSNVIKISISKKEDFNESFLCSKNKNIGILGVKEIDEFKATENDKNVFLEFSQIDPKLVRDNSKGFKIVNLNSVTCSKAVSFGSISLAKKYISLYFKNYSELINNLEIKNTKIKFEKNYLIDYIGEDITSKKNYFKTLDSLKILEFKFLKNNIEVPLYRHDVFTMQDIVEEILRFYGINKIVLCKPKNSFLNVTHKREFNETLISKGYIKFLTYTLVSENEAEFNPLNFSDNINLLTYTSKEHSTIRNSLAISLNKIYQENKKRKMDKISFFDEGMINEQRSICIASDIKKYSEILNDIFELFNFEFEIKKLNNNLLHPNYNAGLYYKNKLVGWVGKFHPNYINTDVIFGEVIINNYNNSKNEFKFYDSSQLKEREITFSLALNESVEKHLNKLKSILNIYSINKVSTFIKNDKKNVSYKIILDSQSADVFDKEYNN